MDDSSRNDIRRLLKSFGILADEYLIAHLAANPHVQSLRLRISVEDLTDYGDAPPHSPLAIDIVGDVRR
ncbi:MAG: hypothetical protein HUU23_07565 [Caldilineales bacterium]|nr:hypothetical protein [Caldilineales bacterium]